MGMRDIKLILVPTDFSAASERALDVAMDIARMTGAALELLHVDPATIWVLPPPGDAIAGPVDLSESLATSVVQLEATIARVRAAGVVCTGVSQAGKPDAEIVDHARTRGAGLIVVGSHGRTGVSHLLAGSVAEKVVRHAPCPILVVPPVGDESPGARPDDDTPELAEGTMVAQPA
jgi:nucleotide-binding universal stress UspA family protein